MTLEQFLKKYNKKKVDFDGAFGAQCVDLFRQYNADVWGNPHTGAVNGAKDLYLNYGNLPEEKKYLDIVPANTNRIFHGDVAVWGATSTNQYGHVGIVVGFVGNELLLIFEQDGFKQDGAKIEIRSRDNLLGFLRKKIVK